MPDRRLWKTIGALRGSSFAGSAYRHQAPRYDPMSGRGAQIRGGRWNPPDSFPVLYLGLDRRTVADEFARLARRSRRDVGDFLPRTLYRYSVDLTDVLDLRTGDALESVDPTPAAVGADRLEPCQRVGSEARAVGYEGILAPSAAGSGVVLALFVDDLKPGAQVMPEPVEVWQPDGSITKLQAAA